MVFAVKTASIGPDQNLPNSICPDQTAPRGDLVEQKRSLQKYVVVVGPSLELPQSSISEW